MGRPASTFIAFGLFLAWTSVITCAAEASPPRYDHVVVVIEENHSLSQVEESPYLASLAARGVSFSHSFAVAHPSQPNYIALFSGSTQGIRNDWRHDVSAPNLALSLHAAGLTFAGYSEDLPRTGFRGGSSHGYVRKHAPWASFTNVPDAVNRPFTDFPSADFSSLPTVSFVIPNLQDDMHDGSVEKGDQWLQAHMDDYARWAVTHNSLLIVTFDEGPGSQAPEKTPIATILAGAHVTAGVSDQPVTHYSILRMIEDMYGLPYIGEDSAASRITGIWD
jgi:hypothetical protein